jgi:hypothetical protein
MEAMSTYLHETIHWWQHVGNTAGLFLSLTYPVQALSELEWPPSIDHPVVALLLLVCDIACNPAAGLPMALRTPSTRCAFIFLCPAIALVIALRGWRGCRSLRMGMSAWNDDTGPHLLGQWGCKLHNRDLDPLFGRSRASVLSVRTSSFVHGRRPASPGTGQQPPLASQNNGRAACQIQPRKDPRFGARGSAATPPPNGKKIRRVISAVERPQGCGDPLPAARQRHTLGLPKCPVPLSQGGNKTHMDTHKRYNCWHFSMGIVSNVRPLSGGETGTAQPDEMHNHWATDREGGHGWQPGDRRIPQ